MSEVIGVIAIQGDFEKHVEAFHRLDPSLDVREVRSVEDLQGVTRAVIPGGESTTVGMLMERYGLGAALVQRVKDGMPIWGTCMGLIMLATQVEGREQYTLGLLDVTVRRNAFGAQVHSFEDSVAVAGLDEPVLGVFIRAPIITRLGPGVSVVSEYEGQVVAARQGQVLGTSYHPELTSDTRLHEWFLSI